MNSQRHQRFGPVCIAALLLGAVSGGLAALLAIHYFPPAWARIVIVTGVFVGVTFGIATGVAWEILPTHYRSLVRTLSLRCLLVLISVGIVALAVTFWGRYRANQIAALISEAGGRRMGDEVSLQFVGTRISDANLKCLQELGDTEWLELFETSVEGPGLQSISEWESLEHLFLNKNPIGNEGVAHLKNLRNLKWLELQQTRISDDGLRHLSGLTKLNKLDLGFTSVSDAGLLHLTTLKALRSLSLENTRVTKAGVEDLKQSLPNCQIKWNPPPPGDGKAESPVGETERESTEGASG